MTTVQESAKGKVDQLITAKQLLYIRFSTGMSNQVTRIGQVDSVDVVIASGSSAGTRPEDEFDMEAGETTH
jgi:hypothetical protein